MERKGLDSKMVWAPFYLRSLFQKIGFRPQGEEKIKVPPLNSARPRSRLHRSLIPHPPKLYRNTSSRRIIVLPIPSRSTKFLFAAGIIVPQILPQGGTRSVMAGKRKAEYALFDCHGCEPEEDETAVETSLKEDDDDEIISEEEYRAMIAESRAEMEEEFREEFARLGIRPGDRYEDEDEEEQQEDGKEKEKEKEEEDEEKKKHYYHGAPIAV